MSALRTLIDDAVGEFMAEHPGYFTPRGIESAQPALVRKLSAAMRGALSTKADEPTEPSAPVVEQPKAMVVERGSREGIAYATLRLMAGCVPAFVAGDGRICIPPECAVPSVWTLADAPARESWPFITERKQIGAWREFFRETLRDMPRREVCGLEGEKWGMRAPWPWPPRKDGTLSVICLDDEEGGAAA